MRRACFVIGGPTWHPEVAALRHFFRALSPSALISFQEFALNLLIRELKEVGWVSESRFHTSNGRDLVPVRCILSSLGLVENEAVCREYVRETARNILNEEISVSYQGTVHSEDDSDSAHRKTRGQCREILEILEGSLTPSDSDMSSQIDGIRT